MHLETKRLILREMTMDDFDALYEILSDPQTMRHYPAPFDKARTRAWIAWNQNNYATFGFGLWAVVLRENGMVIGDCGISMQSIHGKICPEIGYHIHSAYQRKWYATEAAMACRDYVFAHTTFNVVYSYMKHNNAASCGVAIRNGMQLVDEYDDPVNTRIKVYAISRGQWHALNCVEFGTVADIDAWMKLVEQVRYEFPGLEEEAGIRAHKQTVLRFMRKDSALCVRRGDEIAGVLLLSRERNMICCLAVAPAYRRMGVAAALLDQALRLLNRNREISVTTFRAGDPKGVAPRALYRRFGFVEGACRIEQGYPVQRFILRPGEAVQR